MRIVVTNLGKTEIKEDENNFNSEFNVLTPKNNLKHLSISYNKLKNNFATLKGNQTSRKTISIPKLRNNLPILSKKNLINSYINDNNKTFLPKINSSLSPNNSISILNQKNLNKKIFKKAIKVSQKKLNIPNSMFDKYSKDSKEILNDLFKKEKDKDNSKVNNTEENVFSERNKAYSLRDILLPKNQKNIDKKININGGQSIINYLHKDKAISPIYIQKVSQLKNGEITKMDKICQKYLNDEKKKSKLDNEIRKK